jgi:hypothetical protein
MRWYVKYPHCAFLYIEMLELYSIYKVQSFFSPQILFLESVVGLSHCCYLIIMLLQDSSFLTCIA